MTKDEAIAKAVKILAEEYEYWYMLAQAKAEPQAEMMSLLSGVPWEIYKVPDLDDGWRIRPVE